MTVYLINTSIWIDLHNGVCQFERVEQFKYLGTTLTNHNSIQEEIKSRLKSGNACCHSVQNLLSCSLLSKSITITIHRTTILPILCKGVKLGRSH